MHAQSDLTLSLPDGKASVLTGAGEQSTHMDYTVEVQAQN